MMIVMIRLMIGVGSGCRDERNKWKILGRASGLDWIKLGRIKDGLDWVTWEGKAGAYRSGVHWAVFVIGLWCLHFV